MRDKLNLIADYLPDDANTPVIFKFRTDDIPVMILSVQARESMNGLYKILDDRVASPLSRIKGVGTVSISGPQSGRYRSIATPEAGRLQSDR